VTSPENRWRGENYTGWKNPAFDRLVEAFFVTLDPTERIQQRAQMAKLVSEELPSIMLSGNPNAHAYLSSVKNVTPVQMHTTGRITWNIERWELQ
jgi:ABC-type transport system substrate-binding protein